jgi:type II secretory ATPase GspE/PulE/Tfp pilus assembly ATPase PilB-like protein/anti-anti-sigma regulatory factor
MTSATSVAPQYHTEHQRSYSAFFAQPALNEAPWSSLETIAGDFLGPCHQKAPPKCLIDLSEFRSLSSGMMAFLIKIWRELQGRTGQFVIACTPGDAKDTLVASGMTRHWTLVDSREAAMRQVGMRTNESHGSGILASPFKTNGNGHAPTSAGASLTDARPVATPRPRREPMALRHELTTVLEFAGAAPFVDLLFERAFNLHATDIHFDPHDDGMHLRFRVDGIMHEIAVLPGPSALQVISRLKLLAQMDITEKRLAQDGHIPHPSKKHHADVRIGSGPTVHGERIVLRLMPDSSHFVGLEDLGLTDEQRQRLIRSVNAPSGIMLFVGPVGSGKSTTTYTCLSMLNKPERSVVTIEDPVERRLQGVNQIQTDPRIDFGFAQALRGVLRQDPDVIMVGEIRDAETANIATRASLTGVRVLSTLHANDTSTVLDVLRQMGISSMFLADSLNCAVAQRLVRRICEQHHESYSPDAAMAAILKLKPESAADTRITRGIPAESNFFTGYYGRCGIFEVMTVDEEIRNAILAGQSGVEVARIARQNGMMTLEESAIQKVLAGQTTVEEMLRVLTI